MILLLGFTIIFMTIFFAKHAQNEHSENVKRYLL